MRVDLRRARPGRWTIGEVSPIDVSNAIPIATEAELDRWLTAHGQSERVVVVAIFNRASGRQTVSLVPLQGGAICPGRGAPQAERTRHQPSGN